jgi:DNA-binding GntR family transcriptional regulator
MAIPLYRELLNSIKIQIINGFYKEGDLLPSEHELMDTHQVTRSTVRQALSELVNEDYIIKKQGLGSIVTNPRRRTLGLLSVKGFSEAVSDQKKAVKTVMIHKPHLQAWDENFFYPLSEVEKKAGCIYVRRLRCVEEEPVMLESTYIGNLNLPRFCALPFVNGSLFGTLNLRYQVEITHVEQDLRAVSADSELAKYLRVNEGSPLLHVYLKFHTSREHLFIYGSLLCNTLKYSIGNRL